MPAPHLSAVEIAAFIDSTLSPEARAAAELHLSGCARCREELASCMRLARSAPSRPSSRVSWPLLGSIAAAVLIALVLRPSRHQTTTNPADRERAAAAPAEARAIAPINGESLDRRDLRLVWRLDTTAVSYRVVITDSAGAPTWRSDDLVDTAVSPPPAVVLNPGERYYWRVDALHSDGSTSQSSTFGFRITR